VRRAKRTTAWSSCMTGHKMCQTDTWIGPHLVDDSARSMEIKAYVHTIMHAHVHLSSVQLRRSAGSNEDAQKASSNFETFRRILSGMYPSYFVPFA